MPLATWLPELAVVMAGQATAGIDAAMSP